MHLLYLTVIFVVLQAWTGVLIYDKWTLNKRELASRYKEKLYELYEDDIAEIELDKVKEEYTADKMEAEKIKLLVILILCIPCNILVYQGRLLTLEAFKVIKMNAQGIKGIEYNPWLTPVNILFFFSKTYWMRYDEYVVYVQKNKKYYVIRAMIATLSILAAIFVF